MQPVSAPPEPKARPTGLAAGPSAEPTPGVCTGHAAAGLAAAWLAAAGLAACGGDTVRLGRSAANSNGGGAAFGSTGVTASGGVGGGAAAGALGASGSPSAPEAPEFGGPTRIANVNGDDKDDNPTLTDDMLELYFSSTRDGNGDVWFASRESVGEDFSAPVRIDSLSTGGFDASPAISGDGLTLWVGTESAEGLGGLDIFASERAGRGEPWPAASLVTELSSTDDDIPRPPGNGGRSMPLGSRRGGEDYSTYLADRETLDGPFGAPRLLSELEREGVATVDAFLSADGLTLYYVHADDEVGDIFLAKRSDLGSAFGAEVALGSINTEYDERDPWLSADGSLLFFASDRDGDLDLYVAERLE